MQHLILPNDSPYGTKRSFNGLCMAHAQARTDLHAKITVHSMADTVRGSKTEQKAPYGNHKLEHIVRRVLSGR